MFNHFNVSFGENLELLSSIVDRLNVIYRNKYKINSFEILILS